MNQHHNPVPAHLAYPKMVTCPGAGPGQKVPCAAPVWLTYEGCTAQPCDKCRIELTELKMGRR